MTVSHRSVRLRLVLVLLASSVCALIGPLVAMPPTAAAHTELVSSSPEAGERVASPVRRIRLTFSSPITVAFAKVTLSIDGASPRSLKPEVQGSDVTADVPAAETKTGRNQRWIVAYRVVSEDGHPIDDTLNFTVVVPSAPPTATPDRTGTATPATATPSPASTATDTPSPSPVADAHPVGLRRWFVPGLVASAIAVAVAASFLGTRLGNGQHPDESNFYHPVDDEDRVLTEPEEQEAE